jgi:type I restriction-modification system DNA methylase subunit
MQKKTVVLSEDVAAVLRRAKVDGNVVRIEERLDRPLYEEVNKILEALGGKWNRKVRGHVFEGDPLEKLAHALVTGEALDVKKTYEIFETPPAVADLLIDRASIQPGMRVLEPSAGRGALADRVREVCPDCTLHVVEPERANRMVLKDKGHRLVGADFLRFKKGRYDRIVMNPPFARQRDIDHVKHAFRLLKPGGRLVSVMSAGVKFRDNKKALAFRNLVERHGTVEDLPPESFAEAGTGVNAVVVTLDR